MIVNIISLPFAEDSSRVSHAKSSDVRAKQSNILLGNNEEEETLADVRIGEKAKIVKLQCKGAYRRRLLDLGLIPGTEVSAVMMSPLGTPIAYVIRDSVIALRLGDASKIIVKANKNREPAREAL
jgi:ferrous iron transport protein A